MPRLGRITTLVLAVLGAPTMLSAQSLEPRLYVPLPTSMNVVATSLGYQSGSVVMDAAIPIKDFHMEFGSAVVALVRTFGLAGRSAQVQAIVPAVSGMARAVIAGVDSTRDLNGLADPQVRLAVNVLGGPARRRRDLAGVRFGTIVGASLTVTAPLGNYDRPRKLNVGSHRWTVKPELGVVQPFGRSWALEAYAGVSLFSSNTAYADTMTQTQEPLWAVQGHLIRIFGRRGYAALDLTVVHGGIVSVDGVQQNSLQRTTRIGATGAWTVSPGHTLKASMRRGVYTRFGGDFSIVTVGYQHNWGG